MNWHDHTFTKLGEIVARRSVVAILPLGAVEAHGPHLPTGTDIWIAEAMARACADRLGSEGLSVFVLPALPYAPAPFANAHPGTLSIRRETLAALVTDLAVAVALRGVTVLALANSHFDPEQVRALRETSERVRQHGGVRLAYPDLTRRRLAERLGAEFLSGACHAGRYETSILLAERPDLVDERARERLPALPVSLVDAVHRGRDTFSAAGMEMAYCGDPAAASAQEGRALVEELGAILAEAVQAELG